MEIKCILFLEEDSKVIWEKPKDPDSIQDPYALLKDNLINMTNIIIRIDH